jgi:hypothetical protein
MDLVIYWSIFIWQPHVKVVHKSKIYFCMIKRQKIMRQPKNEQTFSYKKKVQTPFWKHPPSWEIFFSNFFLDILGLVLQDCFLRIWKMLSLGWEGPFWKKSIFSQKLRYLRKIRHFVFLKKVFSIKVRQ